MYKTLGLVRISVLISGSFEQPKPEILLGSCLLNSCVYFFNCFFTADDCPLPHCAFPCPRGSYYMRDSYGCQTCQCGGICSQSYLPVFHNVFVKLCFYTLLLVSYYNVSWYIKF